VDIEAMYIDTSVAVKLYVGEPDSEECEAVVADMNLVSSMLLYCELQSALLSKVSRGKISEKVKTEIWNEFEMNISDQKIRLLPLNDLLVRDAADLVSGLHPVVPLRTLDALHLATYLSAEAGLLFTKDSRMLQAAAKMGLPLAG
jgi:predicted nucleic acid-binding protein